MSQSLHLYSHSLASRISALAEHEQFLHSEFTGDLRDSPPIQQLAPGHQGVDMSLVGPGADLVTRHTRGIPRMKPSTYCRRERKKNEQSQDHVEPVSDRVA